MTNASLIQTAFLERSVAIIVALNDASIQLLIRLALVSYLKFLGDIFVNFDQANYNLTRPRTEHDYP